MKYVLSFILLSMIFPIISEAQDWANLARYKDQNAKAGLPAAGENRVVFMGNSITDSWITASPAFFAGSPYLDRGISGQTTPQMLIRFKQDVIDLKPKVVVILAGTNDIAGNTGPSTLEMIEDNLADMAVLAKAAGIEVVLSSVLPAYDYPWKPGLQPAEKIVTLNQWIKEYAESHNCFYLNYYPSLVDERKGMKSAYSQDGVHPNTAGYNVMEALADKVIAEALRKSNDIKADWPEFNHTTVYVVNLEKSTAFYRDVMELRQISEPFRDGRHNWFRIGPHSQLHVVGGAKKLAPHDINIHLSFRVISMPDFMKHLDAYHIDYGNWNRTEKAPQVRPDGVSQIYFQDPDGYWIEVNDDKF
jgi:lysophospholipase L1-like esterase/catechol 2,3-dioxygenase-like lactoylglutathione lyase family enzyme